jgi:hypothetical protein
MNGKQAKAMRRTARREMRRMQMKVVQDFTQTVNGSSLPRRLRLAARIVLKRL